MNPLTNVKNITKLNEVELDRGLINKSSWHDMYKDSAWVFIGGLAYGMTEGDVLAVFSQYGEIVNINLVRDKKTGKIRGFCFLCYANQKSTVLAVDNFNGMKLCGRTIRVDHVQSYRVPKEHEDDDEMTKKLVAEGCAPKPFKSPSPPAPKVEECPVESKKIKTEKKKKKKRKRYSSSSSSSSETDSESSSSDAEPQIKKEKYDPGYEKYESASTSTAPKNSSKKDRASLVTKHRNQDPTKKLSRTPEHSDSEREHRKGRKIASKKTKQLSRSEESQSSASSEPNGEIQPHKKYKSSRASYDLKNSHASNSSNYHHKSISSRKRHDSSSEDSTDSTSNETKHSKHSSNHERRISSAKQYSSSKEKNVERKKHKHKDYDTIRTEDSHKHRHHDDRYSKAERYYKDERHESRDHRKSHKSRSHR